MTDRDLPQIYLITPPEPALPEYGETLSRVLDTVPIACLRLSLASADPDRVSYVADTLREIAHARDVPLVIDSHIALVEKLGLDGVHLPDGARAVRKTRATLGADAILGAFCGTSRHDGLNAGEAGADYVAFGPVGETLLGSGERAAPDLFAWWSEMIELPVVAEGGLDEATLAALAPITDFFAIGPEIWSHDDPASALVHLRRAMSGVITG